MKKIITIILLSTSLFAEQKPDKSLVECAGDGDTKCVQYYIDHNEDLNAIESGYTPLGRAVHKSRIQIVEQLLQVNNVDPNKSFYPYSSKMLPIELALNAEDYDIASLLCKYNASVDGIKLWVKMGNRSEEKAYRHNVFVLNNKKNLNFDKDYPEGLHLTIMFNDQKNAELFVSKGATTNRRTSLGNPLIIEAVSSSHMWAVKLMVENGADVNATDNENHTPLFYAIEYDFKAAEEYLKSKGARETKEDLEDRERRRIKI